LGVIGNIKEWGSGMIKLSVAEMQKIAETNPQAKQLLQQWEQLEARIEAEQVNQLKQKLQIVTTVAPVLAQNSRDVDAWYRLRDVCDEAIEILEPATGEDV
jgi:alpha-glucuronidase